MPLIPEILNNSLEEAFEKALLVFAQETSTMPGKDVAGSARRKAAKVFASLATNAIDSYIRSQTIIVPPGQIVSGQAGPAPVIATTTAPSSPATIS